MDSVQIRSTIPLICDPPVISQKYPHSPQSVLVQANFQDLFDDNWNTRKYSYNQEKSESPKLQTNPTHREDYVNIKRNQSHKTSVKFDFQKEEPDNQNVIVNSEIDLLKFQKKHNLVIDTDKSNNQSRPQRNSNSPSKSMLKFRALGNLVLSVHRLQQNVVEQIQSVEQLSAKLLQTPNNQNFSSSIAKIHPLYVSDPVNLNDLLNNVKLTDRFIYHAQRGSGYDIKQMIKLLQLDPKRHTRSPKDPTHLLNCMNTLGQNSLYLAAKNGNLGVLKFLLEAEANAHIKSRVYDHELESPLQVCVRWNHYQCTKLMLDNIQFSTTEIKEALQQTKNQQMRNLLKSHLSNFFCCFC